VRVALGLVVAASVAGPAGSERQALPTFGTPLSISYTGTFDLTNTMLPQGTQHTYTYHVQWAYTWRGTWGDLFADSVISNQTSFGASRIAGTLHVLWRSTANGPNLTCTLRIVPEMGDFPDFRARYDADGGTLRIVGLEAPTSRYGTYVGNDNPMCGGGPEIDIFGAPASWKPLGDGGGVLSLAGSGVHLYNRNWNWTHSFGHGLSRHYVSSMHSTLDVGFSG
jgi:hypothetical protein